MATVYKLTDEHDRTYGGCQWGEGVTHSGTGVGNLCGPGWIHAYTDPLLAVLLNPTHANFPSESMHLWVCEAMIDKIDHGLKIGCRSLTTLRRMDVPQVTIEDRVRFAILCAKQCPQSDAWLTWADGWLSGTDRSRAAAYAADAAARAAAYAAYAAVRAASAAARAAAYAAYAAARAAAADAAAADAADAADAAARAASAASAADAACAADSAYVAADAAASAAFAATAPLDLSAIAHDAVTRK